ncbi:glutamate-1-semialdehyde-2,1-aminomutase [Paraphotobacterium marinum]|uniref:Glutamate-1-semialdehyde 2,1-aminomutase n=1 Tax=Paraphotobacterium marinum TaxID=1755811 RepID=A0A220VDG0_9GAMM|nr:glutamate-1-semialdehyde 2,1-aminomutase [Paraphotobacterium marinum]ASK78330.1 glutamate-1-semialdehyde-2,1-aminomutase [Paraphotobacterium marinum]
MNNSEKCFQQAKLSIPGGVNSPVRSFSSVKRNPLFIDSAKGAYVFDIDGNEYIDYVGSWGPMILGHNHPKIQEAVINATNKGLSFGAPTKPEITMAELIKKHISSIDKVRMVNSGTEATMSAIRLARGYTGKSKIIKFEGCYHGHVDSLLVKAGSGALTFGKPSSAGIPDDTTKDTLVCQFNDIKSVEQAIKNNENEIAALIIEPVAGNMNCILPKDNFLKKIRELCNLNKIILIFDEVMTGFRVNYKSAQGYYDVQPDLTCLGKIIGGGLPAAAFGGKSEIMDMLAPNGPVYQAGTLSGNPIAMAAGTACLQTLMNEKNFKDLDHKSKSLTSGLLTVANDYKVPFKTSQIGGMFGLFFTNQESISTFKDVNQCNQEHFLKFFNEMLDQGIYLAPSSFEAGFISLAHTQDLIEQTINASETAFKEIAKVI